MRSLLLLIAIAGPVSAQQLPVWRLAASPTLSIGVVEGDPLLQFGTIIDAAWLSNGSIVAADAQAYELRYFDAQGRIIGRVGRRGAGPGEFRWLQGIYVGPGDSVLGLDANRLNLFGPDRAFVRTIPIPEVGPPDSVFRLDVWLHGQFWIEGGLSAEERTRIRGQLNRLPALDQASGYRYVKVAQDGALWIREPLRGATDFRWTILDAHGQPIAVAVTPIAFDLYRIEPARALGRWTGEDDVNFVRVYAWTRNAERGPVPAWLTDRGATRPAADLALLPGRLATLRSTVRRLVVAQEAYFADNVTYTVDITRLTWESPEGVRLDIIRAGSRGWVGVAADPAFGVVCGMGVGEGTPRGWREGYASCSTLVERN
ncbi:MAG: hypothetical protein WD043_12510 [Gemmatimonadales bacterium]